MENDRIYTVLQWLKKPEGARASSGETYTDFSQIVVAFSAMTIGGASGTYHIGKSRLTLTFGDITSSDAQVLVSSDDYYLSMGGGVSAAILEAGGNSIALDAVKRVPAMLGDVVVTTAGTLRAQYIFHAITIGNDIETVDGAKIVQRTTRRCLQLPSVNSLSCDWKRSCGLQV